MVSSDFEEKKITVKSIHAEVSEQCRQILETAVRNGFSSEEIFAIHLAIEEALINAIKHGNKADPARNITISYSVTSDRLQISISDEGAGFNYRNLPDPREDENLCKDSGRGVLLMREYMDKVEFNSSGNCVHMVKYRSTEHN